MVVDVYRRAIQQLLSVKVGVDFHPSDGDQEPLEIVEQALASKAKCHRGFNC